MRVDGERISGVMDTSLVSHSVERSALGEFQSGSV